MPQKALTKEELYAHPGWRTATFEGAEMSTLLLGLKTIFREKLEWLEAAETLSLRLQAARAGKPGADFLGRPRKEKGVKLKS